MAYKYANFKSQSFQHRKIFQGKKYWLCCARKKKTKWCKDIANLFTRRQARHCQRADWALTCFCGISSLQQVVRQSQIWRRSDLQSFVTAHSCSVLWYIFVFSLCLMAILQEKTYSGQIVEVKYLSELSSFCRLHTPGMLNAFSWNFCFMCGPLTIFVLFLRNNDNSQWSQGRLAETHTKQLFLLF